MPLWYGMKEEDVQRERPTSGPISQSHEHGDVGVGVGGSTDLMQSVTVLWLFSSLMRARACFQSPCIPTCLNTTGADTLRRRRLVFHRFVIGFEPRRYVTLRLPVSLTISQIWLRMSGPRSSSVVLVVCVVILGDDFGECKIRFR